MSDKPKPQPEGNKPAPKAPGAPAETKGSAASTPAAKAKPAGNRDEIFEFLAPAQGPGELGRLGHYRVLKVLGRGGMGTVFMAEDSRLHRIVALKVMLPSIAKKAIARDRFVREARAMAAIEHDHIATIYEVNGDTDVPYAAMQYLKGMTLEDWLKAGKTLNVPQILRIGKEIAKGLAAAHSRELIHRDIKPSNIWLDATNKGRVKILDFGLARPTNEETHLTQEGLVLGTPAYMSPEQARGQNVDERCDLFSLGCVLYRLCAGRLPFFGTDTMSILLAITSEEPANLLKLKDDLPPALADLVQRLIAKNPADRPASAKGVVLAIQEIEREWIASGKTAAIRPSADYAAGKSTGDATVNETKQGDVDPALEESAITELELQKTPSSSITAPPHQRSWLMAGLGGALIAVLSICCFAGIFIATDRGQVEIIAEDEDAEARLSEVGLTLLDHHKKKYLFKAGKHELSTGGYQVNPRELPAGFQVEPNAFVVSRGEAQEIRVRSGPANHAKATQPPVQVMTLANAKRLQVEWAKHLETEMIEKNSIGMNMVLIPAGEFTMGSSPETLKQHLLDVKKVEKKLLQVKYTQQMSAETPPHAVRITRPFFIGMVEVTVGQFGQFVTAMKYQTEAEKTRLGGTRFELGKGVIRKSEFLWNATGVKQAKDDPHPVSNVTWADADAFCAWLSKKENKRYRLPTEAEWEFACRAGTNTLWHFGDDSKTARELMWCAQPIKGILAPNGPHPVGKKPGNEFGLFDMHGNVAEMCADMWSKQYDEKGPRDDPQGPPLEPGKSRVARGGSFLDMPLAGRSAYRDAVVPNLAHVHVGFRVVCEVAMPAD